MKTSKTGSKHDSNPPPKTDTGKKGGDSGDGKTDNNKGNKDGSGIDVGGTRPTDPALAAAYDEKKQLLAQGKYDAMSAAQKLSASLAEIKQWGKDHQDSDIQ